MLVAQFIARNPTVSGYTLICVLEQINRRVKGDKGINGLLKTALEKPEAEAYLVRVCESLQAQTEK